MNSSLPYFYKNYYLKLKGDFIMGTLIDITGKIKNEPKFIKLGDDTYKVDDSKNTVTKVMALFNEGGSEMENMEKVLELLLGKKAKKAIDDMNLSMEDYQVPFIAVMACVTGKTYEQAEADFRNTGE